MNKFAILDVLLALLKDVQDPKVFLIRVSTAFILVLSYLVITNQGTFLDFAKNFSKSTVAQQLRGEQEAQYPKVSNEKASILYVQSNSDAVFIAEYTPKFINNYQNIIAWEGKLNVDPTKLTNRVVDRSSTVYQQHLLGKTYPVKFNEITYRGEFVTNAEEYKTLNVSYMFTCPIFNLDNSYAGYVGIAWVELPYQNAKEEEALEEYLERICEPQARALGRAK
ncbi:holin [Vibrio phage JSF12]|uniref:Holin n=2 Tax=Jesfedecavirus TaxID=2560156 RepID=A0A2D0Z612_9CAUD|nr:holin [Vibrio phage JSF10]YP_009794738.1 holin [Vibrio phage JSF12]ASV43375.1 holin [Vibrio phage JSF10]ASV43573.1 holin [Vibrio phage JSF12]